MFKGKKFLVFLLLALGCLCLLACQGGAEGPKSQANHLLSWPRIFLLPFLRPTMRP